MVHGIAYWVLTFNPDNYELCVYKGGAMRDSRIIVAGKMVRGSLAVLVACLVVVQVSSLGLAPYLKACKRSDPDSMKKCITESARAAIPSIIKGDKKYKVPSLNPVHVNSVKVASGGSLDLTFSDLDCFGLAEISIDSANLDMTKKKMIIEASVPSLQMVGTYDVSGQILVLPIKGHGPCNITFGPGKYQYEIDYTKTTKQGKEFFVLGNDKLEFKLEKAYYQLDNLFEGDPKLGPELNKVLNENWQEVLKEVGQGVGDTLKAVVTTIFKGYLENTPINEIVLA